MAIKINLMPRKEDVTARGESRRPFYFSIILIFLIISFIVYLGIYSYNTFFLKKQLNTVEEESADIQEKISKISTTEELSAVAAAVTKGKSIKSILSNHFYGSKIYELLEKLTIKSVSYDKFSEKIGADNMINVSLSGKADSYNALAKQLIIFKKSKEIKDVIFSEATLEKNAKVAFSLNLSLDSKIITVRPVITLSDSGLIKITVGSSYSDAGASAVDGVDGVLPVTTTGSVDTNVAGTYTLIYSAVNAAGNSQTATRTVNVVAP
ncbi:MAG: DUF5011 domain-containing protein [bacterium]|nr:DUF5011 domain-containing protein [bacterium]